MNTKKKQKKINTNIEKVEFEIKDINEDFTKEVEEGKRIIIYVEHSKSYAKEYAFKKYISKYFEYKSDKFVIARAQFELIPIDNLKPAEVYEILRSDLNNVYSEFKNRYPDAKCKKAYAFNYALDYSSKTNKAEIMTVALLRISDEYARVQISPIVPVTKEQYDMLIGLDNSPEGVLLHELMTEQRMGIEQYGVVGYLSNGKVKTHNMYMEVLLDLMPEYQNQDGFRTKSLKYKNYRTSKSAYLFSIKTEEEKAQTREEENELIV